MDFIAEAVKCFGLNYESPQISALLATQASHKLDKPSDGSQFAISKDGGFDLLFKNINVDGGKQNRVLACIFIYSAGVDKHKQFPGTLPLGMQWTDKRAAIVAKNLSNRTWVIGEGRVAVDSAFSDGKKSDTWVTPDFNLHINYHDDGRIYQLSVQPRQALNIESEWKKTPTWQDLAQQPSEKMAAIQLYKTEHSASTIEAKQAIEAFIANQV